MPTRIVMANGDHLSVSESVDAVAEQLNSGKLSRLERPWGDTAIYVNPAEVGYLEPLEDRVDTLDALEAQEAATGAVGGPAGGAGAGPGAAGGPAGGAPHPGGPPNPP